MAALKTPWYDKAVEALKLNGKSERTQADIFRKFGPEYLTKYAVEMPVNHRKVIEAIIRCRAEASGTNIFSCTKCFRSVAVFCSCGNRHCPSCQHHKIPGGVFNQESGFWHSSRIDFYLPVRALSKIFKAKFKAEMIKAGLFDQINPIVWQLDWNVNCQAVGSSPGSLKYLAPYVFKVAISDSRIVKVENRQVIFRYKKQKSSRWRTMPLEVMEFIRRYLQYVLPSGFMKIRYYGFLGSGSSATLDDIRAAIERSLECFVKD